MKPFVTRTTLGVESETLKKCDELRAAIERLESKGLIVPKPIPLFEWLQNALEALGDTFYGIFD